jgi:hypothetical protein
MVTYNKEEASKYGLKVYTYKNLPDKAPNGFWAISDNLIILCPDSLAAHYGAAIIFLSSLGIKKYQVKLHFILRQYGSLQNLANGIQSNFCSDRLSEIDVLSYDEIYLAMYSSPINAVRVNFNHTGCDIRTPFFETNKSAVRLAKDIALFYNKPYNIDRYLT